MACFRSVSHHHSTLDTLSTAFCFLSMYCKPPLPPLETQHPRACRFVPLGTVWTDSHQNIWVVAGERTKSPVNIFVILLKAMGFSRDPERMAMHRVQNFALHSCLWGKSQGPTEDTSLSVCLTWTRSKEMVLFLVYFHSHLKAHSALVIGQEEEAVPIKVSHAGARTDSYPSPGASNIKRMRVYLWY